MSTYHPSTPGRPWVPPTSTNEEERSRSTTRPSGERAPRTPRTSVSPRKPRRSAAEKLELVIRQLDDVDWSLGDFLHMLFRTKDEHGNLIRHGPSLTASLSRFLSGRTNHPPVEIIQLWLEHPLSNPASTESHYEPLYSFEKPYLQFKHAKAAITSMAVQLCEAELLKEVRAAVKSSNGLHGSHEGTRGRKKLGWSDIGAHTISTVGRILRKHQPLTLRLLTSIATPKVRKDAKFPGAERKYRPPDLVAIEALSTLDFSHTAHARLLPAARSILHFACGSSHVLWNYGSRTGQTQSWSTTYETLRELARQDAAEMVRAGQDPARWLIERIDNVQQHHKQREQRVGRENVMRVGVAGTVAEAEDFDPVAADLDDRLRRIALGLRRDLTVDSLLGMIDFTHLAEVAALQWVQTLVNYVPSLRHYNKELQRTYRGDAAKLLVPTRKTRIHPLRPVAKNEAVTTELRDTVIEFLSQIGQTEESHQRRIVLIGGDGLTFEKITKMKYQIETQHSESAFRRLQHVVPFLETWHTEWTFVSAICEVHWEGSLTKDPSKLGHSATKIDQKAPPNLKKVDYYKECFTTYHTLTCRQLDCWRRHFQTDDLIKYFDELVAKKTPLPSFEELLRAGRSLNQRYATTQAYNDAVNGNISRHDWPQGTPWVPRAQEVSTAANKKRGTRAQPTQSPCPAAVPPVTSEPRTAKKPVCVVTSQADPGGERLMPPVSETSGTVEKLAPAEKTIRTPTETSAGPAETSKPAKTSQTADKDANVENLPTPGEQPVPAETSGSAEKRSPADSKAGSAEKPQLAGDRVLAQSILFMRDAIISKLTAEAVARGDIGTVWEALKWMAFCFEGTSHTKYSTYILEMICMLELESSPEFRETFLRNWLVNPSGKPDGNQEGDLLEEHFNRILEEFISRHSMEWDDAFLQEVVAPNVEHFNALKSTWGTGIGLAERRGRHPEPHTRPETKILLEEYSRTELHTFRRGREYPEASETKDMFQEGLESLDSGKLRRWINETLRSRSAASSTPIAPEATAEDDVVAEADDEEHEPEAEDEDDEMVVLTRGSMRLCDGNLVVEYDGSPYGSEDIAVEDEHQEKYTWLECALEPREQR